MPTVDFSAGYRDATKGATLKALQKRRDDQAAATALAMKPREIGSTWQGAAQIADVISGSIREGRIANQEASGRKRFAELLAGGLAPDEIGEAMGLDPETAMKYQERTWTEESDLKKHGWDVDAATARVAAEKAAQQAGFTHADTSREDAQTEAREAAVTAAKDAEKKATLDAALSTKEGELNAAVTSGVMTPEQAAQHLDEYKRAAEADIAAKQPEKISAVPPEVAAARGGDIAKHPENYDYNSKTGDINPVQKARTANDIKVTGDFEKGLIETRGAITKLDEALKLAPNIFEGGGMPLDVPGLNKIGLGAGAGNAQERAKVVLMTPDMYPAEVVQQAKDTQAYFNIMGEQAITAMSTALAGASTDYEMKEFVRMMANPGTPLATKQAEIKRMRDKLVAYEQTQSKQVEESGGNTGAGAPAPAAAPPADAAAAGDPLAEARDAIAKGADPAAVKKRLQEMGVDPTGL